MLGSLRQQVERGAVVAVEHFAASRTGSGRSGAGASKTLEGLQETDHCLDVVILAITMIAECVNLETITMHPQTLVFKLKA